MSLKFRLILSYIAMIIIPIIISVIVIFSASYLIIGKASNTYKGHIGGNPIKQFMDKSTDMFTDIKFIAADDPEKLEDEKYLTELDKKLAAMNSGLVVRKDSKIIYESKSVHFDNLDKELPKFGSDEERNGHMLLGNESSIVRQKDFYFKDNTPGTVFLIVDIAPIERLVIKFVITIILSVIIILIATDGVLTYLVSRSILRPLSSLKDAVDEIKEGNLNFEVKSSSRDEIGELCNAFEEMRVKLKESIDMQMQYENNRKELISNISHDLKTPVTAIKGYVEGIMDGVADSPEKMDRYIKTIYRKASDMDRLIDELFLYSKLDLNKLPFNFEKVDIKKYLEDCVEELQLDLEKRGVNINLFIDIDANSFVVADRERLKRVIINIVENSVKYMDKAVGTIDLRVSESKNKIIIEFKDNGQGIPKGDLPYIFDRFFRADPSRNTSTGGSGLGLAIAKRIIEEHGGRIWAESEEGVGTSIIFSMEKQQG